MKFEDARKVILKIVGIATAFLGLMNVLNAIVINPDSNILHFGALSSFTLILISLFLLAMLQLRKKNEKSGIDPKIEWRVPYYQGQRRRGTIILVCIVGLFLLTGTILLVIDHRLTPNISSVTMDSNDPDILLIQGLHFGQDISELEVHLGEYIQIPVEVSSKQVSVVSPKGFSQGSISIKYGPRESNRLYFSYPGIVFNAIVVEMINPTIVNPIQKIMDTVEPFPAFPYYSYESDDSRSWPPRVSHDRSELSQEVINFLSQEQTRSVLESWEASGEAPDIQVFSSPGSSDKLTLMTQYSRLRMFYHRTLNGNAALMEQTFGKEITQGFLELEKKRDGMKQRLPNRLMILRIENHQPHDAKDFLVEINVGAYVYDVTLNDEQGHSKSLEWSPSHQVVEIEKLRPSYKAEIRVWYQYLPLEERIFPGPADIAWEETQGIRIKNLSISNGRVRYDKSLLAELEAYNRFDVDPTYVSEAG